MVNGFSDLDGEVTATTTLPPVQWEDIDTSASDVINLDFQRQDSNPNGSIEIYRSQTSGVLGTQIASLAPSATTYDDSTANVDEVNYYTLRRQTPDTSTDSTQENTLLPPPGITVTTSDSTASLSWTDAATTEVRYNIYQTPSGESETKVATLDANSTSYDTGFLVPNADDRTTWTYRVEAERDPGVSSGDTTTASEETTFTLTAISYGGSYTTVLREPDGGITQLNEDVRDVNLNLAHTQSSQWDVTVPHLPSLEGVVGPSTECFIYARQPNGSQELIMRGNATGSDTDNALETNTTTVNGWDTSYLLRQGAGQKTYENTRVEDAIQDYWDTFTDFNASVVAQNPEEIVSNDVAYSLTSTSDFNGRTPDFSTRPVSTSGDELSLQQSCHFRDTGDRTAASGTGPLTDSDYVNGEGAQVPDGFIEFEFTPAYTLPAEYVGLKVRDAANGIDQPDITWSLNGDTLASITDNQSTLTSLGWSEKAQSPTFGDGYTGGDLQADTTYTFRVELVQGSSTDAYFFDVVALYDTRYSYTFDNTVDANQQLSGPELYPGAEAVNYDTYNQTLNVTSVDITSTWNDTTGSQQLAASNDGSTYLTADNSSTLTQSFSTVGTKLDVRTTLSRYGSRTNDTPTNGYLGQAIQDIEVRYSANDLSVLDSYTVDNDDFTNLQNLHGQGNYQWTMQYDEDELLVESYPEGEVSKSLDVVVEESRPRLQTQGYYNTVIVRSNLDDSGERETVTATAGQTELDKYGSVEEVFIKDRFNTRADMESFARTKLREGLRGDELRGTLSIHPEYVQPGYEYTVDALGGETMTLESVSYSEGVGVSLSGQLQFAEEPGLVPAVAAVDASLGDVRDAN